MTCLISQMRLLVEVEVETQLSVQPPNKDLSCWQSWHSLGFYYTPWVIIIIITF